MGVGVGDDVGVGDGVGVGDAVGDGVGVAVAVGDGVGEAVATGDGALASSPPQAETSTNALIAAAIGTLFKRRISTPDKSRSG